MSQERVPLFPLPLVLFPGTPLPLHIFEPRYREMLDDCVAAGDPFGIVFVSNTDEQPPRLGDVGCLARVQSTERLPDGRSNILVHGTRRFAILSLTTGEKSYLLADVTTFDDEREPHDVLASLATRLRATFERVVRAARALDDDADPIPPLPDDPAELSFTIASIIDLDAPARQALLVSRSATRRLGSLLEVLEPALGTLETRAVTHARAKSNGRGAPSLEA